MNILNSATACFRTIRDIQFVQGICIIFFTDNTCFAIEDNPEFDTNMSNGVKEYEESDFSLEVQRDLNWITQEEWIKAKQYEAKQQAINTIAFYKEQYPDLFK